MTKQKVNRDEDVRRKRADAPSARLWWMSLRAELWIAAILVLLPGVAGAEPSSGRPASLWVPITIALEERLAA